MGRFGPGLPHGPLLPSPQGSGWRRSSRGGEPRLVPAPWGDAAAEAASDSSLDFGAFFLACVSGEAEPQARPLALGYAAGPNASPPSSSSFLPVAALSCAAFFLPFIFLCACVCVCACSSLPPTRLFFCCFVVPFLLCYSLESAKPSSQAASVAIPDHLSINLSQPSTPSSSSSSTTTPSLATAGAADAPASLPNPLPSAPCVSSLLGMKPVPLLALNVVAAAKGSSAPALPSATNKLKAEKQRFSPY